MKTPIFALFALMASPALAHSGHVEAVDGHTHTFADLFAMGLPAALILAAVVAGVLVIRSLDD